MLLLFSISAWTQESVTVTGIVTDQNKEPLIGVNIAIENMPGLGVITDLMVDIKLRLLLIINWYFHTSDMKQ